MRTSANLFLAAVFATIAQAQILPPQVNRVVNAADYTDGGIAPGEIVSLFGWGLAPEPPVSFALDASGRVPVELSGVRVTFDGVPAPLLYVSRNQINAVAPFEIASRQTTSIVVINNGVPLPPIVKSVVATAPAIFGGPDPIVVNQDGTLNSAVNPAPVGSVVSVYITRAGMMTPLPVNGAVGTGQTRVAARVVFFLFAYRRPGCCTITEVLYAGDAPGLVQGAVQINARVRTGYNQFGIQVGDGGTMWARIFIADR